MGKPLRVEIAGIGAQGDGVAETESGPVYVPFTAPGDVVDVWLEKGPRGSTRASLEAVVEPSPDRRDPACRHFGICGGCALQHIDAERYARWTHERVRTALSQHGLGAAPIAAPMISPPGSRRRLGLKALRTAKGIVLGYNQRHSHQLVDVKECPIARPELAALVKPLRAALAGLLPLRAQAAITLTAAANGVDCLIEAPTALDLPARETLAAFAERRDLAALSWSEDGFLDPIAVRRPPVMRFDGIEVALTPGAFIQATQEGEAALRQAVLDWSQGAVAAVDLFAGLGTFTLPLARTMPVTAAEGAKPLLDALSGAANRAPGLKAVTVAHRDLFRRPLSAAELARFDFAVIDPPRAGARAQVAALAQSAVPKIAALSCNPNTFARDAHTLVDGGYRLSEVRSIDQFLWSPHVELAALFERV